MKKIKTILCACVSGLGSSFLVEMNVKKALKEIGREDIKVSHAGMNDVYKGAADLFICSSDVYDICAKSGDSIPLDRLTDYQEVKTKLEEYLKNLL